MAPLWNDSTGSVRSGTAQHNAETRLCTRVWNQSKSLEGITAVGRVLHRLYFCFAFHHIVVHTGWNDISGACLFTYVFIVSILNVVLLLCATPLCRSSTQTYTLVIYAFIISGRGFTLQDPPVSFTYHSNEHLSQYTVLFIISGMDLLVYLLCMYIFCRQSELPFGTNKVVWNWNIEFQN